MYKVLCLLNEIEERATWEGIEDDYFENKLYDIDGRVEELMEEDDSEELQEVLDLVTYALGNFQEQSDADSPDRFKNLERAVNSIIKFIENNN